MVLSFIKANVGWIKPTIQVVVLLGAFLLGWHLKSVLVENAEIKQKNEALLTTIKQLEEIRKQKEDIEDAFRDLEKQIDPSGATPLSPPAFDLYDRLRKADQRLA